jgi:3-Ketosteroid 9alpha-hydroxylase C-terminal domain
MRHMHPTAWSPPPPPLDLALCGNLYCNRFSIYRLRRRGTVWDDLNIWRCQEYIEHPALSKVDAKPYMAMRKWATQFYEVPASV